MASVSVGGWAVSDAATTPKTHCVGRRKVVQRKSLVSDQKKFHHKSNEIYKGVNRDNARTFWRTPTHDLGHIMDNSTTHCRGASSRRYANRSDHNQSMESKRLI
ncbi:hypothetical protein J6590_036488 [Homalodisca vitripennis]|nr:hypothetical protein J6590_036488 [Homalodisca vitripennis]